MYYIHELYADFVDSAAENRQRVDDDVRIQETCQETQRAHAYGGAASSSSSSSSSSCRLSSTHRVIKEASRVNDKHVFYIKADKSSLSSSDRPCLQSFPAGGHVSFLFSTVCVSQETAAQTHSCIFIYRLTQSHMNSVCVPQIYFI